MELHQGIIYPDITKVIFLLTLCPFLWTFINWYCNESQSLTFLGCIYVQEQLEALPKRENVLYRSKLYVKEKARVTLNFLLLDKDKISENLRGK